MSTTTTNIKFHINPNKPDTLLDRFEELIQGIPNFHFKQVDMRQEVNNHFPFALTLYATNGFNINISGLKFGEGKNSQPIIELLKYCEFELDEETIYTILNCSSLCMTIYNKKYL